MPPLDVALVTCAAFPTLHEFDHPLQAALARRGLRVAPAVWDDPGVDWTAITVAVLRSTWDYYLRRPAFLAWAARVAAQTHLENPLPLVRWNTHKTYLRDLADQGVPIIPTLWLEAGAPVDLAALLVAHGWEHAVLKPMVSADAYATMRVTPETVGAGQAHLDQFMPSTAMMVQPFMEAVRTTGERSLMFIDGALTHAVRRPSRLDMPVEEVYTVETDGRVPLAADEVALAQTVMALVPPPVLYARVDLVRDAAGAPRLMELELVEPTLFLPQAPEAAARLADAIAARVARAAAGG